MSKTEFIPEENTILIDDKYNSTTVIVYPEQKKFEMSTSAKEDVYYNTEICEYRILTNPISVEARLLESKSEPPPDQYSVRDGVVLESEIRERMKFRVDETISNLKRRVEWQKIYLPNASDLVFFLISRHPEIVSKDDYRKFLRATAERIKNGLQKIREDLAKRDSTGLEVSEGEWGKQIWYSNVENLDEKELDKRREHAHKMFTSFFKDEDSVYGEMTQWEFQSSKEILDNVEILLNAKDEGYSRTTGQTTSTGIKFGAFIFQWAWLLLLVSIALWLISLVVTIIQYNFVFAFVASGILTLILQLWRK